MLFVTPGPRQLTGPSVASNGVKGASGLTPIGESSGDRNGRPVL